MGLYSRYIFPSIVEWTCSNSRMEEQRRILLRGLQGVVLEIGLGTGLNLPHYPEGVDKILGVDPNRGMESLAQKRILESSKEVVLLRTPAEAIPIPDGSVDSAVSTWTLCSVKGIAKVLQEIHRVLKPGGSLYFLEHGKSPIPFVHTVQKCFNPIQGILGDGCSLTVDYGEAIEESPFQLEAMESFCLPRIPRAFGTHYRGKAKKAS